MSAEQSQSRFPTNRQGSVLVVALWVIAILEIFTLSAGYQVRQKISLAERLDRRNWLYGVAEAGVYDVFMKIREEGRDLDFDSLNEFWSSNEKLFREVAVGREASYTIAYEYLDDRDSSEMTKKVRYGAQDEESKINLNTTSVQVLAKLFEVVAGIDASDSSTIAYSIVDWRDSDSFASDAIYGAEDDYYDGGRFPYEAKDAPFEVLQELLLVRGMNQDIYEKIRPYLTVYGTGTININTVSKKVLMGLGLTEKAADQVVTFRSGRDGEEGTEDDQLFASTGSVGAQLSSALGGSSEIALLTNLISAGLLTTASNHFMIRSLGQAKGTQLEITAVVNREGKILLWSVGKPQRIQSLA